MMDSYDGCHPLPRKQPATALPTFKWEKPTAMSTGETQEPPLRHGATRQGQKPRLGTNPALG